MLRIPEEFDDHGRLVVSNKRDEPPLGEGMASVIAFKLERGTFRFAMIRDTDPRKGGGKNFQLPGGRAKTPERRQEKPLTVGIKEFWEEAGALLEDVDLEPVCLVGKANEPLRNEFDQEIRVALPDGKTMLKRGVVYRRVFTHFGPVVLRETTDKDAKEPRWLRFSEIVHEGNCSFSHIVILTQSLRLIALGFRNYCDGLLTDEWDLRFYRRLARAAKENGDNYRTIEDFVDLTNPGTDVPPQFKIDGIPLDALEVMSMIPTRGSFSPAAFCKNFTFEKPGAQGYFL